MYIVSTNIKARNKVFIMLGIKIAFTNTYLSLFNEAKVY